MNTRKIYKIFNFLIYLFGIIAPYFVLSMSITKMPDKSRALMKYGWIIAPYIWFAIHGTLITGEKRAPWVLFSLGIVPASLYFYYFVNKSFHSMFIFSPAIVLIGGLVCAGMISRLFKKKKTDSISVRYDQPEK